MGNADAIYVGGITFSPGFFTTADQEFTDEAHRFLAKLSGGPADLEVTLTHEAPPPGLATDIVFTLTAMNNGPEVATHVSVTDNLPEQLSYVDYVSNETDDGPAADCHSPADGVVSCDIDVLEPGERTTIALHVRPTATGTFTNRAEIAACQPDPDPSSSFAEDVVVVTEALEITLTKDSSSDSVVTSYSSCKKKNGVTS